MSVETLEELTKHVDRVDRSMRDRLYILRCEVELVRSQLDALESMFRTVVDRVRALEDKS